MFNTIIVDDEEHVRMGLTELVDWETLGFKIAATANSGTQAIDVIIKYNPHVVFIDIRMPGLTGLEVIQEVRKTNKKCHFIILSGYSDFSYAKEAISLDVEAYLLKPLDEEELLKVLSPLKSKLEEEISRNIRNKEYELFEQETWLKQRLDPKGIHYPEIEHVSIYQLAVFKSSSQDIEIISLIKSQFQQMQVLRKDGLVVLLFTDRSVKFLKQLLKSVAYQFNVTFSLSNEVETAETLPGVYRFVKAMLSHSFCFEGIDVLTLQEIQMERSPYIKINDLYLAVELNNSEKKQEISAQLERYYQATLYSQDRIMGELANLQTSLVRQFRENYEILKDVCDQEVIQQVFEKGSLQQILSYLQDEWDQIHLEIGELFRVNDDGINKIKHYIEQHYADDINLQKMSEIFSYNITYLGQKFKAETGITITRYIDNIRIEKAKFLLMNNKIKVYEVAKKVGYPHMDSFYKKFKKYEGMSAREYQRAHQKIN